MTDVRGRPLDSAERYAIHDEIAAGGMATVHIGRLLGAGGFARTVAIKQLYPQFAKDPEFSAMFLEEARLAARIRHPNVVPTLDVTDANGQLHLVMEYVHGESLAKLVRLCADQGELPPLSIVTAVIAGMLHGLHAAHEATSDAGDRLGIVHRDVSPQNVLVGVDGVARVLDFGVAKALGRSRVTAQGTIKGKLAYMAPEQLRGGTLDRRTDVYAASVVLWEMLTCRRLFDASSDGLAIAKILEDPISAPSSVVPSISAEVDELVLRGLRRPPDKRFASAREMALALERLERPATPSEVGEWVERLASSSLSARARRVAEIEGGSRPTGDRVVPTDASAPGQRLAGASSVEAALATTNPPEAPGTPSASGRSSAMPRKRLQGARRRALWTATLVCAAAAGGFFVSRARAPAAGAAPSAEPSASAPVAEKTDVAESPSSTASAVEILEPDAGTAHAMAPPLGKVHPKARAKAPATSSGKTGKQPPNPGCYLVDSSGLWQIKPECM